jgi:uncharacterized protein
MTPQERQMLSDLFERIRSTGAAPRDPQAEAFISDSIRTQTYAPYVMAQTVIVQQHALEAAQQRIQELEAQTQVAQPQQETSFLGRLFGGAPSAPPPARPGNSYDASTYQRGAPGPQDYPPQQRYAPQSQQGYAPQQNYAPQQSGPWGAPSGGGGFLSSALQTATGVAGGVLAANAIESMFGGNRGGGGLFGGGSENRGFSGPGEVVNNYYGSDPAGQHAEDVLQDQDQDQDDAQDAADDSGGGWDDNNN